METISHGGDNYQEKSMITYNCDQLTGQCTCKPYVIGQKCDRCADGFFNIRSGAVSSISNFNIKIRYYTFLCLWAAETTDYRCADGRFLMSPRGVTVSNTRYLSSSETRVNAGI
jgi:hypothetical protein